MPKITPGNRLYLYQLLSRELGMRRQTLLPRAEEALEEDGLCPEDLGCEDMRSLCEQLSEFIKLTVFKKGYVYVTVVENEEYDRALAKLSDGAGEKGTTSGKPWKRKRGAKALKPVKPRHVERVVEEVVAEPEVEAEVVAEAETELEPVVEAAGEPEVVAEAADEPEVAAEAEAEPDAAAEAAPEPEPTPEPDHAPSISLTITYVPEPEPKPEPMPEPASEEPVAASPAPTAPRIQSDLPQDFHSDVRCSSEQLSILYQVLPSDVDPMATLEEDFRIARSTSALEGTRSNVRFALRYLQPDGITPVHVTLRRSARAVAGKRWALTEVEAGSLDDVNLDGLAETRRGAWRAFACNGDATDPERTFAQTVAIGSWDDALQQLAQLAAPEDWGSDGIVLRDYLTMTFARVRSQDALAISPDGTHAEFDTRLLSVTSEPIYAHLSKLTGDIPWQLDEFSTSGTALPVQYVSSLHEMTFDGSLSAPSFLGRALVERNPRLATPAYDPISNRVVLLVPDGERALALWSTSGGYEKAADLALADAYTCARVISADQPSWLSAGLNR